MNKKSDKPAADSRDVKRRHLLQLLAVGGVFAGSRVLPETWVRPVIDEVVLPAHAQMSPGDEEEEADIQIDDSTDDDIAEDDVAPGP